MRHRSVDKRYRAVDDLLHGTVDDLIPRIIDLELIRVGVVELDEDVRAFIRVRFVSTSRPSASWSVQRGRGYGWTCAVTNSLMMRPIAGDCVQ